MKLFRKWYFKLYHLLKFLGIFIILLTPNIVKANTYNGEINECWNDKIITLENGNNVGVNQRSYYKVTNDTWEYTTNNTVYALKILIPVETGKNYYIRFFDYYKSLNLNWFTLYDENKKPLTNTGFFNNLNFNNYGTYSINSGLLTFNLKDNENIKYISFNFMGFIQDRVLISDFDLSDLSVCPPTQEPEPTGNTKLDDFLTIYIDRLTYLSEKTIENQYMLAFVGIIFGFIVLEITLHIIHIRGGYKK